MYQLDLDVKATETDIKLWIPFIYEQNEHIIKFFIL